MIAFANSIISSVAYVNEEEIRVVISFAAKNQFGAFKAEAKLLKKQLFWSC